MFNESKLFRAHAAYVAAFEEDESAKKRPLIAPVGSRIWFKDKYNQNEFIATVLAYMNHGEFYWYQCRVDKVVKSYFLEDECIGALITTEESEVIEYDQR